MHRIRSHFLPILGAGFVVLVAIASFLIIHLTGAGPGSASDLPVVAIGQTVTLEEESADDSPSNTLGDSPGVQNPSAQQQGGGQSSSEGGVGGGQTSAPGQQNGLGGQNGSAEEDSSAEQGGGGSSSPASTTPTSGSPPDTFLGSMQGNGGGNVAGMGTTGSTLRQTINGGVRVEGSESGRDSGAGSPPATSGGSR